MTAFGGLRKYRIRRFHRFGDEPAKSPHGMTKTRLTLEEAQAWCQRSDTHGDFRCCADDLPVPHEAQFCPRCGGPTYPEWFDGYDEV